MQHWQAQLRAARTRGGAWTPASPTADGGLLPSAWYDPSELVGYNDGDTVQTLPDLSGNGYNASQATAALRPYYKTSIQNGLAALNSPGTRSLVVPGDPFGAAGNWCRATIFVLAKQQTLPDWQLCGVFSLNTATSTRSSLRYLAANGAYYGIGTYGSGPLGGKSYTTGAAMAPMALFRHDMRNAGGGAGSMGIFINGSLAYSVAPDAYTWGLETAMSLGGIPLLGVSVGAPGASATYPLYGWVGECLMYQHSAGVSAADIAEIEGYLNTKWAVY